MKYFAIILAGIASVALCEGAFAQSLVAPSGNTPPSATPLNRPYPIPAPATAPKGEVRESGSSSSTTDSLVPKQEVRKLSRHRQDPGTGNPSVPSPQIANPHPPVVIPDRAQ